MQIKTETPWIFDAENVVYCSITLNKWPSGTRKLYNIYFHVIITIGSTRYEEYSGMSDIDDVNNKATCHSRTS